MEITIFLRCYNYTLNGKWFKNNDEMTNLGEYNFTQNISLNLYQLNEKNGFRFHFSEKTKMTVDTWTT